MNKKIFLLVILITVFTVSLTFSQQKVLPGAVSEPFFWLKSKSAGESYYWESLVDNKEAKVSLQKQDGAVFNFNPSIVFNITYISSSRKRGVGFSSSSRSLIKSFSFNFLNGLRKPHYCKQYEE